MRTPPTFIFYSATIMKSKKVKDPSWFKLKRYPHIGLPVTSKSKNKVIRYITNPEKIAKHAFCPFIHTQIITPKFRKQYDQDGNILHNGKRVHLKPKVRDIYYANHWDANIFAYYAYLLQIHYEKKLNQNNLGDVVTAYRKITTVDGSGKCNIDFAKEVFDVIKHRAQQEELTVIAVDIEGFFDNLDHALLKNSWKSVLGLQESNTLPKDHYNVYKAITQFSYIDYDKIFELFKEKIIINHKGKYKQKSIKKITHLYSREAVGFCQLRELKYIRSKGIIYSQKRNNTEKNLYKGICQGSAISATLANIYMINFDTYIHQEVQKIGGIYKRYSDDIAIVCNSSLKNEILVLLEESISKITKLNIKQEKTQIFYFFKENNSVKCLQEFGGQINKNSSNRRFEYLGFSFDGTNIYLKNQALAQYYMKMSQGVKRCKYYSKRIQNNTKGKLFINRLHYRYSYLGAKKSKRYIRRLNTKDKWVFQRQVWGNFLGYTYNSTKIMQSDKIRHQVRRHWKILNTKIKK